MAPGPAAPSREGSRGSSEEGDSEEEELANLPVVKNLSTVSPRCRQSIHSFVREGEEYLVRHRQPRKQDAAAEELVAKGVRGNRFGSALRPPQVDAVLKALEYFSFAAGDCVVEQGKQGNHFFVLQEGSCEVLMDGTKVNSLGPGDAFGAIALLYNCPRTATVRAQSACGVWGANGQVFRKVVEESAREHHAENVRFLNRIRLFDSLLPQQKGLIERLALLTESFQQGSRVVTEGQRPSAIYFVKRGELSVVKGGKVGAAGDFSGGERTAQLCAGSCFGERAALFSEPQDATVVADGPCELLCIGIKQLKEVLGCDLVSCLEQSHICSVLRTLPLVSHLSAWQHQQVVGAMDIQEYDAGERLQESSHFLVVLEGSVERPGGLGRLKQGQWCHDTDVFFEDRPSPVARTPSQLAGLVAGKDGARVASLGRGDLERALRGFGLSQLGSRGQKDEALEAMRRVLLARKVPIFNRLSKEQLEGLAPLLELNRYDKGARVFLKDELGSAFFVVAKGELAVLVDGKEVRTLRQGAYFGERALLFDEPRSATVQVSSTTAELWSLDQRSFRQVVTEQMRQELVQRMQLQDTDFELKSLRHVRLIGAGAFGSVRLVQHRRTGQCYALKRVKKKDGRMPLVAAREWQLLAEVDHPFVVRMVRTFETRSSNYILTELITGGQLSEEVRERMGLLSRKQVQFYAASLVLALEVLHSFNIVHRDLKPENVMLDRQGYLKLVDFGLAKKLDTELLRTFSLVGTPLYMAPEVVQGNGYGLEVDMWALGVIIFEFVCGVLPFGEGKADEHEVLAAVVNDELSFPPRYNDSAGKRLIQALLTKDPAMRLGASLGGWEDVKASKFFKVGVSGDLFGAVASRAAEPPVVPTAEQYSREQELNEAVSLSDSEELGAHCTGADSRTLAIFRLLDERGDGRVSYQQLGDLLRKLDPATFTESAVCELLGVSQLQERSTISYEEFLHWIACEEAGPLRKVVDIDLVGQRKLLQRATS